MDPQLAPNTQVTGSSKDDAYDNQVNIAYITATANQSSLLQRNWKIQSYVCTNKLEIIHLQECRIDIDTFAQCGFLTINFNIYSNNKPDRSFYGTASLVRSNLSVTNIHTDNEGRVIIFNAAVKTDLTTGATPRQPSANITVYLSLTTSVSESRIPSLISWLKKFPLGGK